MYKMKSCNVRDVRTPVRRELKEIVEVICAKGEKQLG
jgi:hypothetical protein